MFCIKRYFLPSMPWRTYATARDRALPYGFATLWPSRMYATNSSVQTINGWLPPILERPDPSTIQSIFA